jgi:hypothetical protein
MRRISLLFLLLNIQLPSLGFSAPISSLIPLEKFFDNPKVDSCQISPDVSGKLMTVDVSTLKTSTQTTQ